MAKKKAKKAREIEQVSPEVRASNLRIASGKAANTGTVGNRFPIQPPALPSNVVPTGEKAAIAMDYNPGVYDYAQALVGTADFQGFPGYPYLAGLSTRAEYRAFASTMSSELFRQWIKIHSKNADDQEQDNPRITELEQAIEKHDLLGVFQRAAVQDCLFGRGQISINIKGADNATPLVLDPRTLPKGSLQSFTTIEAMWTSPSAYNAIDPTAPDFYKPREWFVLGKRIHASRLLTIITRPLPDMLKPAYNFSGMSLSQLAEPYVNNWLRTRQSVSDLINNFSITALKTNMAQVIQGCDDGASLFARADLFTLTRSNRGLMLLDKENEELVQVNTPLSGLHELQAQSQEHLCSVTRIPSMILTGISPTGMNASSEGEIRAFYDWLASQQQAYWYHPLDICIKVLMLDLWGEIDDSIGFEFNPLWQTSATEEAQIRLNNAQADAVYLDHSVLSQEEVRTKLARDPDSGYSGIDVNEVPEIESEIDGIESPADQGYEKSIGADGWITVKPNGPDHVGRPVLLDDNGVVQGGMGGKFKGEKISEVKKDFVGPKSPKEAPKEKKSSGRNESLTDQQRNSIFKTAGMYDKYGAGKMSMSEFKEKVRAGELDHLYPEVEAIKGAAQSEQKAKQEAKNQAWRDKNLPGLTAQKNARLERERKEREEKVGRAKSYQEAIASPNKTYLNVPYSEKDAAKAAGAFWDSDRKKWFVPGDVPEKLQKFAGQSASGGGSQPQGYTPSTAQQKQKRSLPQSGRIDENDPSLYGHELLGHEGETWKSFLMSENGRAMKRRLGMDEAFDLNDDPEQGWDDPKNYEDADAGEADSSGLEG